ncbi:hypothetical protein LEP1GSC162_2864 [Leptospira santarosai str. CBC1531]|nr:hypothetical protein LEP1GSC162_2864 [Leptospira santarosai str. CBC1531]
MSGIRLQSGEGAFIKFKDRDLKIKFLHEIVVWRPNEKTIFLEALRNYFKK